jgi:hypothetical protein
MFGSSWYSIFGTHPTTVVEVVAVVLVVVVVMVVVDGGM